MHRKRVKQSVNYTVILNRTSDKVSAYSSITKKCSKKRIYSRCQNTKSADVLVYTKSVTMNMA